MLLVYVNDLMKGVPLAIWAFEAFARAWIHRPVPSPACGTAFRALRHRAFAVEGFLFAVWAL